MRRFATHNYIKCQRVKICIFSGSDLLLVENGLLGFLAECDGGGGSAQLRLSAAR